VTVFGQTNHLGISPSHLGQLNLLPSAGREMSTRHSAMMLYGWGAKAGWLIPYVDKRGWQVNLRDPSLTRANQSAPERSIEYIIKSNKNVHFILLPTSVANTVEENSSVFSLIGMR